jgi:hypothetical protein
VLNERKNKTKKANIKKLIMNKERNKLRTKSRANEIKHERERNGVRKRE